MEEYKKVSFTRILKKMKYRGNKRVPSYKNRYSQKSEGYIIGEFYKYSGDYVKGNPGTAPFYDDFEPAELKNRKRVNFYKVLISYNNIVFVNKNDIIFKDKE